MIHRMYPPKLRGSFRRPERNVADALSEGKDLAQFLSCTACGNKLDSVPGSGPVGTGVYLKICSTSTPEFTQADVEAWLDGFVPYALQKNDIAGMVVLVVKDGKILLQKGYGYADLAKRTPMDPGRTIVNVASVSKLFTWTAVMQLVEQGKLDLDRDVNDYLDFKIPPAFGKPITMRNLMTHYRWFRGASQELCSFRRYGIFAG